MRNDIVDAFHKSYYESAQWGGTWQNTWWMGHQVHKCPLDLWLFQELIFKTKPELIIESGTCHGGSAYYMACLCELIGQGQVVTIDVKQYPNLPTHPRLSYIVGSSLDSSIIGKLREMATGKKTMVVLDSEHTKDHVLNEMNAYGPLVSTDCYLIVEDGNINNRPVEPFWGPGPFEAIEEYLKTHPEFEKDTASEDKFLLTFNPSGYLRKRKAMFQGEYDKSLRTGMLFLASPVETLQFDWEFRKLIEVYRQLAPKRILEIGSHKGGTLYQWLVNSPEDPNVKIVALDLNTHEEEWARWLKDMPQFKGALLAVKGSSSAKEVISEVKKELGEIDFLFIDGDHHYESVKSDFMNYGPMVRRGGIIAFHDIVNSPNTPETQIHRLWDEIREAGYLTREFFVSRNDLTCGIGVVYV